MSYQRSRFVITPRDPGWNSVLWIRQLTEPPPFLHEDDWPLIEHIRATGQLESGSRVANDDWFDRPIYDGQPVAQERTAIERAWTREAEQAHLRAERKASEAARRERKEAFDKAQAMQRKRKAERIARERVEWEMQQARREHEAEARRLVIERAQEQQRRDLEWKSAEQAAERARQLRDMRQRFKILREAAKNAEHRRHLMLSHIMETLREWNRLTGKTEMNIGEVMDIVGCPSEEEMQKACVTLGLNYRPD